MKTGQTVFNIIWLDDQIDIFYKDSKKILRDEGIKVLDQGAHDVEEFEKQIQKYRYVVDAVVTDANINLKVKEDFSGLVRVSYLIENNKRPVPFFVYTGHGSLMRDNVYKDIIDKYVDVFEKQKGIEPLINAIKETVLKVNSKEFRIHNKYKKELEAASLISGNEDVLMKALLYEDAGDWSNTEIYFNSMRSVADSIFSACKREKIIPDVGDLNQISRFLRNNDKNDNETYVILQEIMPKPLARGLWYFLNITQDASHNKDELELKVVKYVQETQNINLFRSVLYIAMDLCLWYAKCKEELNAPDYKRKWERRGISINSERPQVKKQIQDYEYEGIVRKREDTGRYYSGKYSLANPKDGRYKEGDTIRIIKSEENDYKFCSEEGEEVDRFVFLCNIRKV